MQPLLSQVEEAEAANRGDRRDTPTDGLPFCAFCHATASTAWRFAPYLRYQFYSCNGEPGVFCNQCYCRMNRYEMKAAGDGAFAMLLGPGATAKCVPAAVLDDVAVVLLTLTLTRLPLPSRMVGRRAWIS